jgi:uncharacterized damage-inducible protein DinB
VDSAGVLLDLYGRLPELLEHAVDGLPPEQLVWTPSPGANTIGWLVWHLTRVEDHTFAEQMGDSQLIPTWADRFGRAADPNDTGYGDDADQVMTVRPESADALLEYHAAVHQRAVTFLTGCSSADLDRVVDTSWDPPVTLGVRLVSVADDAIQHAGQAAYVRGLLPR